MTRQIRRVAIIGTGVIGASWTALFLSKGIDVAATDVAPGAEDRLHEFLQVTAPQLEQLEMTGGAPGRLTFHPDVESAVKGADLVQENGPERLDFKQPLYARLDALLDKDVIIASSSSGLTMSAIQTACEHHPERCAIGHPFNPPHLIPLVEIVGGKLTSEDVIDRLAAFYATLGKRAIKLRKEVPGHVANRLQAALWREVVYLVSEGVVTVADADAAVSWGPGLRWGVMGPTLLFHLGGGRGGIEHFFDQFTGPMTAWWSVLGNPEITPEVRRTVVSGLMAQVGNRSIEQLAADRDDMLMGLLAVRASHPDAI